MQAIIGIVSAGLGILFLTVPILNRNVFHAVNIAEVIEEGREGIMATQECLERGDYSAVRDSARSLIHRFRNDSTMVFLADITEWDSVWNLIREDKNDLGTNLLLSRMAPEDVDTVRLADSPPPEMEPEDADTMALADSSETDPDENLDATEAHTTSSLGYRAQMNVVTALNHLAGDEMFFAGEAANIPVQRDRQCRTAYERLISDGVLVAQAGGVAVKPNLTPPEYRRLRAFHVKVIARLLYPQFVNKEMKRNRDWASEYISQTAYYFIGASYRAQFLPEEAIRVYDSLIALYPKTLYAEELFLQIGQMLYDDGRGVILGGKIDIGREKVFRSIRYLEKIEKNREVAAEFPKYRNTELTVNAYVNLDEASRAKKRVRQKTTVYTLEEAKKDLSGKSDENEGGNTLEDAVKLIGECYILIGETDSARAQLGLFPEFFPESDNLDDAQKAIADSYAKDGDMLLAGRDSAASRPKAVRAYASAVKQYQKFVNVYPQSGLISQVYISMGDTYHKMGKGDDAARAFSAALDLAKETEDKARVQLEIGSYYYERNQYEKALRAYEIILKTFMSTKVGSNAQYLAGECLVAMGDTTKGMDAFKTIVEYYKQSQFYAAAAHKVGSYYFERADYKKAMEYYRQGFTYAQEDPLAPKMLFQMGMVWVKIAQSEQGEGKTRTYNDAIKQFQKVVERYRGSREADQASFQLADCFMKTGREEAARKAIKEIQSRDIIVQSIKIIGIDVDNPEEELNYWGGLLKDAVEDEEKASILYDMAKIYLEKKEDYDSSLVLYTQVVELTEDDTKRINAQVGISFAHSAKKQFDSSIVVLDSLLENRRVSPELRQQLQIQLYDAHFNAGNHETAIDGFENFAAQYPSHRLAGRAHYYTGTILAQQGKHEEALKKMETVIDNHKDSDVYDKAVLGKGEQLMALGKAREGVAYLEKFLKDNPVDSIPSAANFYLRLGEAYHKEFENDKKALQNYSIVVEQFEHERLFSFAAYKQGLILRDQGKDKDATQAFDKVKREESGIYRAAQAEIAKILAKTDPEAAVDNYRKIVEEAESAEDSALAMVGIGDVYKSVKKWKQAAAAYEKVYGSYHGVDTTLLAGTIVKWIDALLQSKQNTRVVEIAQIMQKRFPDNEFTINTHYYEASAWFARKSYSKARKKFQTIIKQGTSPQLTEIAYLQKANCLFFLKKYKAAIGEYGTYLKKYPKGTYRANALYMQGNAYWTLENFGKARVKFQEIVSKYPEFADICNARKSLAFCEDKLDNWQKARKIYNQILKSRCPADVKTFAREQIEKINTQH